MDEYKPQKSWCVLDLPEQNGLIQVLDPCSSHESEQDQLFGYTCVGGGAPSFPALDSDEGDKVVNHVSHYPPQQSEIAIFGLADRKFIIRYTLLASRLTVYPDIQEELILKFAVMTKPLHGIINPAIVQV